MLPARDAANINLRFSMRPDAPAAAQAFGVAVLLVAAAASLRSGRATASTRDRRRWRRYQQGSRRDDATSINEPTAPGGARIMTIRRHRGDLPDLSRYHGPVAIDTETMGLDHHRDRLCLVQLSPGDGSADVVEVPPGHHRAPNLERLFADPAVLKIFHFARFDLATLCHAFGVMPIPVYCTKIASRLTRTYTDKHGLKDLARDLLGIELSKQQQLSDWGSDQLSEAQLAYAASDVLHLHALKERLDLLLVREGREALAAACFGFLPDRARLDLAGWGAEDIFAHS
jgi:ribonuclease D